MTTKQKTTVRVFAGFIALYLLLMLSFTSMWQEMCIRDRSRPAASG